MCIQQTTLPTSTIYNINNPPGIKQKCTAHCKCRNVTVKIYRVQLLKLCVSALVCGASGGSVLVVPISTYFVYIYKIVRKVEQARLTAFYTILLQWPRADCALFIIQQLPRHRWRLLLFIIWENCFSLLFGTTPHFCSRPHSSHA